MNRLTVIAVAVAVVVTITVTTLLSRSSASIHAEDRMSFPASAPTNSLKSRARTSTDRGAP